MKHYALIFILLLIGGFARASAELKPDTTNTKFHRIEVGANFSNDMVQGYEVNGYSTCPSCQWNLAEREQMLYGYTATLDLQVNLTDHWSLGSGIQFSSSGGFNVYRLFPPDENLEIAGPRYTYYYFSVPVRANYMAGKKKVRFITSAGVSIDAAVMISLSAFDVYAGSGAAYHEVNVIPFVSAGIDYSFYQRLHLRLEPVFRYAGVLKVVNQSFGESNFPQRFWLLGLNTGLYCVF